jgi:hypothetical protein
MIIPQAQYESLRQLFFDKITDGDNKALFTLQFVDVAYADRRGQFLGEGEESDAGTYQFQCFYRWMRNDKMRERSGVETDVDMVIYISPIDLFKKTGSYSIPENYMKAFAKMRVTFIGEQFEIKKVVEVEPMAVDGGRTCIAYQFDLKDLVV